MFRKLLSRVEEPVITDRSIDLLAAGIWLAVSQWGFWSFVLGLPTISIATSPLYELIWGFVVFLSAAIASLAAFFTFIPTNNMLRRIVRKRTEFAALCIVVGFGTVYPALLLILSLGGDFDRVAAFWGSLPLMFFGAWRLRHLYMRISTLREVMVKIQEEDKKID